MARPINQSRLDKFPADRVPLEKVAAHAPATVPLLAHQMLVSGYTATGGYEPWLFNGSTMVQLPDINPNNSEGAAFYIGDATNFNGLLYFSGISQPVENNSSIIQSVTYSYDYSSNSFASTEIGYATALEVANGNLYAIVDSFVASPTLRVLNGTTNEVSDVDYATPGTVVDLYSTGADVFFTVANGYGPSSLVTLSASGVETSYQLPLSMQLNNILEVSGNYALLMEYDSQVVSVNLSSGAVSTVPEPGNVFGHTDHSALAHDGDIYFARDLAFIGRFDVQTGTASSIAEYGVTGYGSVFLDAEDGQLFYAENTAGQQYIKLYDERTGTVSQWEGFYSSDGEILNGKLYFTSQSEAIGYALYELDPNAGVRLVMDFDPGGPGGHGQIFGDVNGTLLFSAYSDADISLWSYDGSVAHQLPVDPSPYDQSFVM